VAEGSASQWQCGAVGDAVQAIGQRLHCFCHVIAVSILVDLIRQGNVI